MSREKWFSFPLAFLETSKEVDRLFDELIHRPWGGTRFETWTPLLDVYETPDEFVVEVDLPGVREGDIGFEVAGSDLTLRGERSFERVSQGSMFYRRERVSGRFERSITLPQGIDAEGIRSEFAEGVLRIVLPKREQEEDDYE